jgi:hypothetical protein
LLIKDRTRSFNRKPNSAGDIAPIYRLRISKVKLSCLRGNERSFT